jgi:hypothetical protein
MQDDLDSEKRALTKQWAKRQQRIELLITGTASLYGEIQSIVGSSMPEVEGLTLPLLGSGAVLRPLHRRTKTNPKRAHRRRAMQMTRDLDRIGREKALADGEPSNMVRA